MFKVAIDAGHGINTPGKRTPDGEREWSFNDKVVRALISELNKYEGVSVLRTDDPTGKTDVSLSTRTNKANAWDADIYISIHHNANTGRWGTWTGTETFTQTGVGGKAVQLAKLVQPELVKAYGLRNRGLKTANFHITRETKMPAILVEGGYMDSSIDIKKLRDDNVLKNAGIGVAKAVASYAKLKKKAVATSDAKVSTCNCTETCCCKASKVHTVVSGDTLWGISRKYKTTVREIKSLNGLKSDEITKGQKLIIEK